MHPATQTYKTQVYNILIFLKKNVRQSLHRRRRHIKAHIWNQFPMFIDKTMQFNA